MPPSNEDAPIPDPMAQFMQMIELLTSKLNERGATSPSPGGDNRKEPKAKDPETFDGQRSKLSAFLTECRIIFTLQKSRFPDDSTKVHFAISFLRDTPLLAIRPYLARGEEHYPEFLQTFDAFAEYLRQNYGDPDERGTAKRKMRGLVQTGSASAYFAEFNQHAAVLGWQDEEPAIEQAMFGLKDSLKDEIARAGKVFKKLSDLINYVVPLDNRLWERELEKKKREKPMVVTTTAKVSQSTPTMPTIAPTPPKFDGNSGGNPTIFRVSAQPQSLVTNNPFRISSPRTSGPRGPLSEEEKARRRANNECTYCGERGHYVAVCPRLDRQNARFNVPQQSTQTKVEIAEHPAKNGGSLTM